MCTVMWGLYENYSRGVEGDMCTLADIVFEGHLPVLWNICMPVVMVKLFSALSSYVVYTDIVVLYLHVK